MNISRKIFAVSLAALMQLSASGVALAHGDEKNTGKAQPIKMEQKDWGIAGDPKKAVRSIEIKMLDTMRFSPAAIKVRAGETITFIIRNTGKIQHEMVIGTRKELEEHAALMLKFPGMEHEEPYMAHVSPGKSGRLTWTFNRAGEFEFACLIAGHFQAGMVGRISVAAN